MALNWPKIRLNYAKPQNGENSMYTVYYSAGSCSTAVKVILNEIGADYEAKDRWTDASRTAKDPEFLKVNPRGTVPTLVTEGTALLEGAAIITYLCEKHKSPLLPASGIERAKALQWLAFANATLHPAYGRFFWSASNPGLDEATKTAVGLAAADTVQTLWNDVEAQLEKTTYLAGSTLTAGDILLTVIANWSPRLPKPIKFGPKTSKLLREVSSRPSYQAVLKAEGGEYKVAA